MITPEEMSTEGLFACRDGLTCRHHADKNYMYLHFSGSSNNGGSIIDFTISTFDIKHNPHLRMALETMLEASNL